MDRDADPPSGTPPEGPGVLRKIIQFPLTRIIIALVAVAVALIIVQIVVTRGAAGMPAGGRRWLLVLLGVPAVHFVYIGYVRLIERREVRELSFAGAGRELGLGVLLGVAMMTLSVLLLWLAGFYAVEGLQSPLVSGAILAASIQSGYIEEVMFRAILFRITEEGLGSWWALAVSSAIFGLAHITNPNATWVSSAAIAIEAGVLLGAVYMLTRRLWAVAGTHFAWNYTQGGVFGVSVSGMPVEGMVQSRLVGPQWISGGEFGIEASALTVAICLGVAALILRAAIRKGELVAPFWRR